jgi:hypothetical protein
MVEPQEDGPDMVDDGKSDSSSTYGYYSLRADLRRCAAPLCGGFFVTRSNRPETRCADGTYAAECYVGDVAYAKLGLSTAQIEMLGSVDAPRLMLRGRIEEKTFGTRLLGGFVASEAWLAPQALTASGTLHRVIGSECSDGTCSSFEVAKLNSLLRQGVSRLNLEGSGASAANISLASATLDKGLLVAGEVAGEFFHSSRGEAIRYRLDATQFFTRVRPEDACPSANDPKVHYASTDPAHCRGIRFVCTNTQNYFGGGTCGCGCIDK